MPFHFEDHQEEFLARLTDAAYHVVLRQGLQQRSFVDVELELWREIRNAAQDEWDSAERFPSEEIESFSPRGDLVEVA